MKKKEFVLRKIWITQWLLNVMWKHTYSNAIHIFFEMLNL